jgi:16S rRNA (uracil1498-N3)-methyltransferase
MVFSYCEQSGEPLIELEGENFRHIVSARRSKVGEEIRFRNLRDGFEYTYEISAIGKKSATATLLDKKYIETKDFSGAKIGWCIVDPKTIEKILPHLNELGVKELYFIYSARSQKNFKPDFERMEKILINSCCQCGRNDLIKMKVFGSLKEFMDETDDFSVFDFGGEALTAEDKNKLFLIGPEGGFGNEERELFGQKSKKILSFSTKNILKSETAVLAAATFCILQ